MKNYIQAPLPFQGQKRKFLKQFKTTLKEFPEDATYVDLFGGSGLLSHTVKAQYPDARVVYNDFDNYSERLANVPKTNKLLGDIRSIVGDYPRHKLINAELKDAILRRINQEKGFVDYVTLSSSLLFSVKYVNNYEELTKETMYNNVRLSNYSADGYLEGVEVVRKDYRDLFNAYSNQPNVIFLIDPPYLSTDTKTYTGYWKLKDYLDVLTVVKPPYFYFTSNKSQVVELCDWFQTHTGGYGSPFKGSVKYEYKTTLNHNASYTDIMLVKK